MEKEAGKVEKDSLGPASQKIVIEINWEIDFMNELQPHRILVVLAHPDDESYGMGGTLTKYSRQGVQVTLLCATRGEAGISGLSPEEAGKIREQELLQAAKHLGIDVAFLGYMDGELANLDPAVLIKHIGSWIEKVQPQVILTFGPEGVSGHPDHVTISHIVTQAVDQFFPNISLLHLAPSEATVLGCGVSSSVTDGGDPMVAVDISEYKIEKIRAIQCHTSQKPPLGGKPEEEVDKIPCNEYFTIARPGNRSAVWFELINDGQLQET